MGLKARLAAWLLEGVGESSGATAGPFTDPSWWAMPANSPAGVAITPENALKISTVYACRGLLSETIGTLPLVMFRRLGENGRERARNHPLYSVLHDQPNMRQTRIQFVEMLTGHALMRGHGYAFIVPGPRGFADQLVPIHPDLVRKELLTNGRVRYMVRTEGGQEEPFNQEDIFEIMGPSEDGVTSAGVIAHAKESLGMTLAAEQFAGRFYKNNTRPGGVLKANKPLKKDVIERLRAQWQTLHSGENAHRVAILEDGMDWQQVGVTPEEAQFLGTREFQAEDVCRWFRVPPHMVGLTSKATSWGSGIEQMGIGFVTYTLMPWLERWLQAITRDLILAPDIYFADFIVDALLRGDTESRYSAYNIAVTAGFMTRNEVRQRENLNPLPGLDEPLQQLNMSPADAALPATTVYQLASMNGHAEGYAPNGHYRAVIEEAAGRVARKEAAAMHRIERKAGDDLGAWQEAVADFFSSHGGFVAQTMQIPAEDADFYSEKGALELRLNGPTALSGWEDRRVAELVELTMESTK